MYSIVHVIYGTYINKEVQEAVDKLQVEAEDAGFETLYHGGGVDHEVGFCGVELDCYDECTETALPVAGIKFTPTAAQIAEAQKAFKSLDPSIQKVAPKLDTYLVFATS
jgi:hypothetical protein